VEVMFADRGCWSWMSEGREGEGVRFLRMMFLVFSERIEYTLLEDRGSMRGLVLGSISFSIDWISFL
jgi:hypothetical protein